MVTITVTVALSVIAHGISAAPLPGTPLGIPPQLIAAVRTWRRSRHPATITVRRHLATKLSGCIRPMAQRAVMGRVASDGRGHATSSAVALTTAVRSGTISACELLELYLERIERLDRAPSTRWSPSTRSGPAAAASAADDAVARGEVLGPLHGLPMTIKDAIETGGVRSTGGAVELARPRPGVGRARRRPPEGGRGDRVRQDQPAALVGRHAGYNEIFGTTNNPWSTDRTYPVGRREARRPRSRAGFTSFELGTDIGGSVRDARALLRRVRR